MKKRLSVIAITAVLLVVLAYSVPIPVSSTVDALEINMADSSYAVPRIIEIEGKYHLNLFSKDVFSGSLSVSGYENFCKNRILNDILLSKDGYPLSYRNIDGTIVDDFYLGRIYGNVLMKDLLIGFIYDDSGEKSSTENCNIIVTGVKTREEASKRFEDIFYNN